VHLAIAQLNRVDLRVLALLWHLAERWGVVAADGVVVPLRLTHATLGRFVGAQRPTVTLALQQLSEAGDLARRPDGAFVLRHGSAESLAAVAADRRLAAVG
jgi:CRP-like cAMP-binding protein